MTSASPQRRGSSGTAVVVRIAVLVVLAISSLTACGGGGPPTQDQQPTAPPAARDDVRADPSDTLKSLGWQVVQEPHPGAITVMPVPAALRGKAGVPGGPWLRVHLSPGETTDTGGYRAPRAEVYQQHASSGQLPAQDWPIPPGSVRWFSFSVYLPNNFPVAEDSKHWLLLTQWKGRDGGSPPLAIGVSRTNLRLGGSRANAGLLPLNGYLGPVSRGRWTSLAVGIRFSPNRRQGWVQAFRDGRALIPRTKLSTMDLVGGKIDPIYVKQGLYRSSLWDVPQTVLFSPLIVSDVPPARITPQVATP